MAYKVSQPLAVICTLKLQQLPVHCCNTPWMCLVLNSHIIQVLQFEDPDDYLILDSYSWRNLEVERNLSGDTKNSLLELYDGCSTAMGARTLRRWFRKPSRNRSEVQRRHIIIGAPA